MSKSLLRLKTQHNYQNEPFSPCKNYILNWLVEKKMLNTSSFNKKSSFL